MSGTIYPKFEAIHLEENVNNYLTRLTLAPASPTRLLGIENPSTTQAKPFNWSYLFSDGTRLVGRVSAQLDRDGNRLLNPKLLAADYLDVDGQTVLLSWSGSDFACFDATVDGKDNCVVASNDNFVANSMSLVSFETRSRAQITDWGSQLIVEPFGSAAWSLTPEKSQVSVGEGEMGLDLALCPFFPFFFLSLNLKLPNSRSSYQWIFTPLLPFYPFIRIVRKAPSSEHLAAGLGSS